MTQHRPDEHGIPSTLQTICLHCGGSGVLTDPVHAVIGGVARDMESTVPCAACERSGHVAGVRPPV